MTLITWTTFLVTTLVYWALLIIWALAIMSERDRARRDIARVIATRADNKPFDIGLRVRGGRIVLLLFLPLLLLTAARGWWGS